LAEKPEFVVLAGNDIFQGGDPGCRAGQLDAAGLAGIFDVGSA
jgi:hypothetical protein